VRFGPSAASSAEMFRTWRCRSGAPCLAMTACRGCPGAWSRASPPRKKCTRPGAVVWTLRYLRRRLRAGLRLLRKNVQSLERSRGSSGLRDDDSKPAIRGFGRSDDPAPISAPGFGPCSASSEKVLRTWRGRVGPSGLAMTASAVPKSGHSVSIGTHQTRHGRDDRARNPARPERSFLVWAQQLRRRHNPRAGPRLARFESRWHGSRDPPRPNARLGPVRALVESLPRGDDSLTTGLNTPGGRV
jgi:hypothetical protein